MRSRCALPASRFASATSRRRCVTAVALRLVSNASSAPWSEGDPYDTPRHLCLKGEATSGATVPPLSGCIRIRHTSSLAHAISRSGCVRRVPPRPPLSRATSLRSRFESAVGHPFLARDPDARRRWHLTLSWLQHVVSAFFTASFISVTSSPMYSFDVPLNGTLVETIETNTPILEGIDRSIDRCDGSIDRCDGSVDASIPRPPRAIEIHITPRGARLTPPAVLDDRSIYIYIYIYIIYFYIYIYIYIYIYHTTHRTQRSSGAPAAQQRTGVQTRPGGGGRAYKQRATTDDDAPLALVVDLVARPLDLRLGDARHDVCARLEEQRDAVREAVDVDALAHERLEGRGRRHIGSPATPHREHDRGVGHISACRGGAGVVGHISA